MKSEAEQSPLDPTTASWHQTAAIPTRQATGFIASVAFGQARITQTSPSTVTVNQITDQAIINWPSFNLRSGETVNIIQSGASSVEVVRITSGSPTQILGRLISNGQVWIVNPNGVIFGNNAEVNVAGLIATAADISKKTFSTKTIEFDHSGKSSATVVNEGSITVAKRGIAVLVAPCVTNDGVVNATSGTVILGSGMTFTLDPYGDHLYKFTVDPTAMRPVNDEHINIISPSIVNSGTISVQSGTIVLNGGKGDLDVAGLLNASGENSSQTGGGIQILTTGNIALSSVTIDASGASGGGNVTIGGGTRGHTALPHAKSVSIDAASIIKVNAGNNGNGGNVVVWSDGTTSFNGRILAGGGGSSGNGGSIETSGEALGFSGSVDASAARGNAGAWLLDPNNVIIRSAKLNANVTGDPHFTTTGDNAYVTTGSIDAALNSGTSVTITTSAGGTQLGTIEIAGNITKSAGNDAGLTLDAASGITVDKNVAISSISGKLNVTLDTNYSGNLAGRGGITFFNGSSISSNGGNILAGGGSNPIAGAAVGTASTGIRLISSILNSGGGDITVNGAGSNAAGGKNYGVYLSSKSSIIGGGGNITVNGTGGSDNGDANHGVYVAFNSSINGGGGNIAITGTGGNGSAGSNVGVFVDVSTAIDGGGGNVSISGFGGNSAGNFNSGVYNRGIIDTRGIGGMTISGTGGGKTDSGDNFGVALSSGATLWAENGAINVIGTGGGAGAGTNNFGIYITSPNSSVRTTGSGSITMTGFAGDLGADATGVYNFGVLVNTGGTVQVGSSGNIKINGTGGNGANTTTNGGGGSNIGVFIAGSVVGGGTGTDVAVTGNGGNSSRNQNYGIIDDQGAVVNTGTGNVTLKGTAGGGSGDSGFNCGIQLSSGGIISVADGALNLNGTAGGAGSGSYNIGVYVTGGNSAIRSTGMGSVAIAGAGGDAGGSGSANAGVRTDIGTVVQAVPGNISISGDGGESYGHGNTDVIIKGAISVNRAPIGTASTVTTLEDTSLTLSATDFGFTDPNNSPVNNLKAVEITTLPNGTLTDNGTLVTAGQFVSANDITGGKLIYTPGVHTYGTSYDSLMFQVQDDGGTANGGVDTDPTPRLLTFDVTYVDHAPVGASNTVTTLENMAYTFTTVDFGFTDPNNIPADAFKAVAISTLPIAGMLADNGVTISAGQIVNVTDIVGGQLVFTPMTYANGTAYANFSFQVQDDGGTANGGVDTDPTAKSMTINVTAVNQAPVGSSNTVNMFENTVYAFLTTDFGFSDPNDSPPNTLKGVEITTLPGNGTLTDSGTAVTAGQFVAVSDISSGKLIFMPTANTYGTGYTSFSFQVQDDGGTANGGANIDPNPKLMTINVSSQQRT